MALHNEVGKIGEDLATKWLIESGLSILERNYRKKFGEIDIVARETTGGVHFVEVKTVSYETRNSLVKAVSHGTYRPEEHVHQEKQRRLKNAIESWILERNCSNSWQIDILSVRIVPREKYALIEAISNIIFE
jgi:putative endonuclease